MNMLRVRVVGTSQGRRLAGALLAAIVGWAGAGCGGGDSDPVDAAAAPQPAQAGEVPPTLTLAQPRMVNFTNHLALAWTSEAAFSGSIVAQIELGLSFAQSTAYTLQHNGPSVIDQEGATVPASGVAHFEFRYVDGFFVMTALEDNDITLSLPYGVDIYPFGVQLVPPIAPPCTGNDTEVCYTGFGFINWMDWPNRAGGEVSLVVARPDPAALNYSVLLKPNEREDFRSVATGIHGQSTLLERGAAWKLDFPTAQMKLRGCNAAGDCIESAQQPLRSALVKGVIPLKPQGSAPNAHVAMSASGDLLVAKSEFSFGPPGVLIYSRGVEGRWFVQAPLQSDVPGFGRTFALSGDGLTLAVQASPCTVSTMVCNSSAVHVFVSDGFSTWTQQARFDGVRAPHLSGDGNRMVAIGIRDVRGDAVVAFVRNGTVWGEQAFPALGYAPLDIELSADGATLAVARHGTTQNPCGCRAVVIYDAGANQAEWHQVAVLHSSKHTAMASAADDDGFGSGLPGSDSLAFSADGMLLAVGASFDSSDASDTMGDPANHGAPHSGAVHLFNRQSDGTWHKQAFVKARGAAAADHFGHLVALSADGHVLFGGARGLSANAPDLNRNQLSQQPVPPAGAGQPLTGAAAYVFEQASPGVWSARATVVPPTKGTVDFEHFFGLAVSADGATTAMHTGELGSEPANPAAVVRTAFVY
jgi:hypothetical protein